MPMIRRYEFTCTLSAFTQSLVDALNNGNDPYWDRLRTTTSWDNWGCVVLTNKKDPNMRFTMSVIAHSWGVNIRWGLRNQGSTYKPDLFTNPPSGITNYYTEMPFMCYSNQYNITYKWTVITNDEYVFIHGERQNYHEYGYPVRIFMGRCNPLEPEDPAVANKFYGVFTHMPVDAYDSNQADQYNTGRGVVMASRNGSPYTYYNFSTDSLPSPGIGGRYYVTPFMVFHNQEGVRGEFNGMRSIVFKNGARHPDGSILDLGADGRYYVFHVVDQDYPNYDWGRYYYVSNGHQRYFRPVFFHGARILDGGQRALLFQI